MKKKNLEVEVLGVEKQSLSKQVQCFDKNMIRFNRDYENVKGQLATKVDDIAKLEIQNQEYQTILLENEKKISDVGQSVLEVTKQLHLA